MAYKFQLGKAVLSGSVYVEEGLQVTGSVDLPADSIENAELVNDSITIAGHVVALGGSQSLDTDDIGEGSNLYWTVARGETMFDNKLAAADTGDLAEGSNLYYTEARGEATFDSKMAAADTGDLAEGSNLYYTEARGEATFDSKMAAADTGDLAEGSNLYYTDARVHAALSAGEGLTYDAAGQFAVTSSIAGDGLAWNAGVLSVDTAEIAAGLSGSVEDIVDAHLSGEDFVTYAAGVVSIDAALFTGSADAAFDARLATKDTDDLAEGSNLYYTDARARAAHAVTLGAASTNGSASYDAATGVITVNPVANSWVRQQVSANNAAVSNNGSLTYNSASGQFSFAPVDNAWVRQQVAANNAPASNNGSLTYNSGSGQFSFAPVDPAWVRQQVSVSDTAEIDMTYNSGSGVVSAQLINGSIANARLTNSQVTVTAGDGLTGGGAVALGASINLDVAVDSAGLEIAGDKVTLKSTITGNRTFTGDVTINNLYVTGTTTTVNTTQLTVADALITIASGTAAFAADQGIELGGYATLKTAVVSSTDSLSSSLPLAAPEVRAATFYGSLVGSATEAIQLVSSTASSDGSAIVMASAASGDITFTLPAASGWEGKMMKIKKSEGSGNKVTVAAAGADSIDGVADIKLVSPYAAIALVSDGSNWFIF